MKTLLTPFCALGLLFSSSQAAPVPSSKSAELAHEYRAAGMPRLKDTLGWFAGHCYRLTDPDLPSASLLAIEVVKDSPKMVMINGGDEAKQDPDFFFSLSSRKEKEVEEFLSEAFKLAEDVQECDRSLEGKISGHMRWNVRIDKDVLYVRISNDRTDQDWAFCRFTKKLR